MLHDLDVWLTTAMLVLAGVLFLAVRVHKLVAPRVEPASPDAQKPAPEKPAE